MDKFTVITPTGDRPEAFELCKKYVQRQAILPFQWIIVDDGQTPMSIKDLKFDVTYIRRQPNPKTDPKHTLGVNMLEAFKHVKYDRIIMVEDDDWYCPNYFEQMLKMFGDSQAFIIGSGKTVYYNIPFQKYYVHNNTQHASWCMTGFTLNVVTSIEKIIRQCMVQQYPYIDLKVWRQIQTKKYLRLEDKPICMGIKGLPGRPGTCSGHRTIDAFKFDVGLEFLKKNIGNDVEFYERFWKTH